MTPREFLAALWQYKPEEHFILLWTYPEKRSRWFTDIEQATAFVESVHGTDVYVGVGLAAKDYGPAHRCPSSEITGITGIWADLDLLSEAHAKKALPRTIEEALSIIPAAVPPTIVVRTGNGAHAWWLFKEPLMFDSEEERRDAATVVNRWHTLLRYNAAQRGWAFDRLADLARILRIPGTVNAKDLAHPKPVEVFSQSERLYNLSDFEEYLDDMAISDPEAAERAAQEWNEKNREQPLAINVSARVTEETITAWMAADMRFRNTWERKRHDLKDQSQSGYDLALACFGYDAGLEDQEIVNLIVHHRAAHNQKQRTRSDYFERTLRRARERTGGGDPSRVAESIRQTEPGGGPEAAAPAGSERTGEQATPAAPPEKAKVVAIDDYLRKAKLVEEIAQELGGVPLLRIIKITGKEPTYQMELADATRIEFSSVARLIDQNAVRNAFAAAIDTLIAKIKPKAWEELVKKMLRALTVRDGGYETDFKGGAVVAVRQYLLGTQPIASIEDEKAQYAKRPTMKDGQIAINAADLCEFINKTTSQKLTPKAVASQLEAIGAVNYRHRVTRKNEQSRWLLPLDAFPPAEFYQRFREEQLAGPGEEGANARLQ